MLTANNHKNALNVRKNTGFYVKYAPPLNSWVRIIGMLAGNGACLAANAAIDINYHAPSRSVC